MTDKSATMHVATRLQPEEVAQIDAVARREERTRSQVIRILVRAGLAMMARGGLDATGQVPGEARP